MARCITATCFAAFPVWWCVAALNAALHDHQPAHPVCPCVVSQNVNEQKSRENAANYAPFAVYDTATAKAASQTKGQQKTRR